MIHAENKKAQAVIEGMAEVEMCMPQMRTKAEKHERYNIFKFEKYYYAYQ